MLFGHSVLLNARAGDGPFHISQSTPSGVCSAGRSHGRAGPPTPTRTVRTAPMRPLRTYSTALRKRPPNSVRCWLPVWKTTSCSRAARTMARPSAIVSDRGFSQYTSLRARAARMDGIACQ
jgi:hypothetical protein